MSNDPFYCPHCRLDKQELELKSLRDLVTNLSSHLSNIADELAAVKLQVKGSSQTPVDKKPSYAACVGNGSNDTAPPGPLAAIATPNRSDDRRFNVVVSGIKEPSSKLPRAIRAKHDLDKLVSSFSSLDSTTPVSADSIKDMYRLGKFNPDAQRPWPLLVKFLRASNVNEVLAMRLSKGSSINVRRDLPKSARDKRAILMKECWKLISAGTERKRIKISKDQLFVDGAVYGMVDASGFMYLGSQAPVMTSADPESPLVSNSPASDNLAPASPSPCYPTSDHSAEKSESRTPSSDAPSAAISFPTPHQPTPVGTVSSQ